MHPNDNFSNIFAELQLCGFSLGFNGGLITSTESPIQIQSSSSLYQSSLEEHVRSVYGIFPISSLLLFIKTSITTL